MSNIILKTRTRILEACLHMLESSAASGVRMTDIAKQAGITRQALYLHFKTRAQLLIATTIYLDEQKGVEQRLAPSRAAQTGLERLDAYIEAWAGYIPDMYGVAKALLAMKDTDEAAAKAWDETSRTQPVRKIFVFIRVPP